MSEEGKWDEVIPAHEVETESAVTKYELDEPVALNAGDRVYVSMGPPELLVWRAAKKDPA